MRRIHRFLLVACALFGLQLGSLIAPAYACGCGAMIPEGSSRVAVTRETSAVHWDGRTEQIVMRFTVGGNAPRAAWIMPVPSRASVELGDRALFDELERLTAPEHRTRHYFWPRPRNGDWPFDVMDGALPGDAGAPAPGDAAPPVGVVGRERLGDFDVARLTATDPDALGRWLDDNGFELPDRLAPELAPYVEQKWEYVAVRLAPDRTDAVLAGTLDPLRIRFASDRLVYPMRLSRLAREPQSLGLYVVAPHRMEPRDRIGGNAPEVTYAGRIAPSEGAVGRLTGGAPAFLTSFEQRFPEPSRIDGDHELRAADADTPYRRVMYENELLTVAGVPVWLLAVGTVLAAALTAVLLLLRVRSRRLRGRSASQAPQAPLPLP
ncbi:DUF2330 domain-containing protein [Streptomyces sp. NPDC059881]|uniref:DUF2330 domain-containing protein n=1 Tax=Streptomyces sp. NPDC059881 TaxID=3346986 RepID=UPI00366289B8